MNDLEYLLSNTSQYAGYISFTIWLFAQLPQIIENHLNQSVNGVNLLFLSCWILGDVTNLLGCILTKSLFFQLLIASYYCFIDIILSFQYYYYTKIFPFHKTPHNLLQSPNMVSKNMGNVNRVSPTLLRNNHKSGNLINQIITTSLLTKKKVRGAPINSGKNYASLGMIMLNNKHIGKISAWTCTTFYISSRLPQIFTNFKNKSTSGISPYLFMFAMLGNIFYSISIVTDLYLIYLTDGLHFNDSFCNQLPFLLGSAGTVFFDSIILTQCWYYKSTNQYLKSPKRSTSTSRLKTNQDNHSVYGGFQQPDWYTSNFIYEDDNNEHEEFYNHSNILNDSIYNSPPPHHYISKSFSSPVGQSSHQNQFLTSNSFKKSSIKSIPVSNSYQSPNLTTSLIPSIINSYTSVNKKLTDDKGKTPFSPSDFLTDEFHTPIENSSFSLNN